MTYIERARAFLLAALMRIDSNCPLGLVEAYMVLVVSTGQGTTDQNVHDTWTSWRSRSSPRHPDIVEFDLLSAETKARDRPYRDAIRDAAGELDEWRRYDAAQVERRMIDMPPVGGAW